MQSDPEAPQNPGEDAEDMPLHVDEHALRNWAQKKGVTRVQLADAIDAVGPSPSKVREYLERKGGRTPSDKPK